MANKKNESSATGFSRRRFLQGVGAVGAGAVIGEARLLKAEEPGGKKGVGAEDNGAGAGGGVVEVVLTINGTPRRVGVEGRTTLLGAMRDRLEPGITGPKLVCDMGACGACTVLMDGRNVYSCMVLAVDAVGKKITTVEGLGTPDRMNAVQKAFCEKDGMMCGFCTPGFVTTVTAFLETNPNPTLQEVKEACKGNFCRCGTYTRIFEAALSAAKATAGK